MRQDKPRWRETWRRLGKALSLRAPRTSRLSVWRGSERSPQWLKRRTRDEEHGRQRWWHEDGLVNQRITWLLTTQGVVAGAYGFLVYRICGVAFGAAESMPTGDVDGYLAMLSRYAGLLVIIGIVTSFVSFAGTAAACLAQYLIARKYQFGTGVSAFTTLLGWCTALATPVLCMVAWTIAIAWGFHHQKSPVEKHRPSTVVESEGVRRASKVTLAVVLARNKPSGHRVSGPIALGHPGPIAQEQGSIAKTGCAADPA